jgi:hypothetical protein
LQGGVLVRRSDATHCEDRLTVGRPRNHDDDACTARPGLLRSRASCELSQFGSEPVWDSALSGCSGGSTQADAQQDELQSLHA